VHSLMIGGGGYVYPRYMDMVWPGSRTDVVEIDPAVTKAAFAAFGLSKDTPIKYYHEDGRVFVDRRAKKARAGEPVELYDFIYFDAFNDYSVPYQLTTQEFMQNVAMLLAPDGGCLINVIDIYESGLLLGSLVNTVQTVFPYVSVFVEGAANSQTRGSRNTFVIACFRQRPDSENICAKDENDCKIFALTDEEMTELREKCRQLVLTDEYAPVENLLVPVVKEAALDKAADEWADRAKWAVTAGKYDETVSLCRQGLELFPDHKSLLNTMGLAHFSMGRLNDAIETLKRAVHLRADHISAHRGLVDCYLEVGENKKAIPHFRVILSEHPTDQRTRYSFGTTLASLGRYQEAIEQFNALSGIRPDFSKPYNSWAYELYQKGDLEGAIEKYKEAVEYDSNFAEARLNLAKILLATKRYEEAVDAYSGCLGLNLDDPDVLMAAHVGLGSAYAAQELFTDAERCYREALRFARDNVEIRIALNAVIKAQKKILQPVSP
ncbi:MAG: fused MFS/spermidine synthase, partial [Candidatus Krumholzibacteria bacterium]